MDPHHSSSPNINICRRCLILLLGWSLIIQLNAQPKPQEASDVDVCVAKPECTGKDTQKQRFPTPDNCTSYFECRGNNLQTRECQRGFIFDHDDSECKKNIDCQIECDHSVQVCEQNVLVPVQCKSSLLPERNYSDTTDCQKYYQCRTGKLFSLECPSNNLFDGESNTCVVRGTETCETCGESLATPAPPSTPTTAAPKDPDNLLENTVAPGPAEITTQTTQSMQTEAPTTSESPPTPEPPKPPLKPCAPFSCSKQEDNGKDAPHPSDCTKYRECNIDTILVRDCAIGSSFDVDQLICINKDEAKCSPECVPTSDEATGGSENEADAPTSAAPAKTTEPTTQTTAAPPVVTQPAKEPTTKAAVGGPDALTSGPSDGNIEPEVTVPQESENTTIPPGPGESSTPDAGIADPATTTTVPTKGPIIEPSPPLIDTGDPTTTTTTAAATTTTLLGPIPDPTTTPQGPVIEPSFPGIDTGDPTTTSTTTTTTTVTPPTTKIVSNEPVSNPGDPGAPTSPPVVTPSPNPTEPADPVIQHSITTLHDDEPFVREGSDGTFTCTAFLPKKVLEDDMQILQPNPRIVWALKATKLMASARVQIRTDDYSSMSELISSRIIINNMEPKDSGNLTCTVMHENKVISEKVRLVPVLGRPSASISVSLNAVTPGETVSATCKVNQPSSLVRVRAADILWYKDRRFLSRSDDEVLRENKINIDDLSRETSILRLVVSERTEISCSALNGAGSSDIASKIINVVKQGIEQNVYCPEEVDGGVTWRRTLAGSEVIINCSLVHERAKGEIVRMCKRSADNEGVWGTANHGQCVTEEFKEILTEIENIEDSLTPINETQLQHVTNHVVEKTKSKDPLLPGDINIAVEVIGKVADIRKRQEMALPVEQLNVTMTSVSNLLDDKNLDSWKNLTEEEPNAGANILSAVDTLIEQSVKVLEPGTNKTISTPNVVMMMESMSKDKTTTVQFPPIMKNSQQSWMKRQGDFIKLEKDTLDYVKNDIAGSMLNISGVYYRNLDKILSTEGEREHVNSKVVALTVYGLDNHARLKPPVSLKFTLEKEYPNDKMNNCSFWNFDIPPKGAWSTIGCRTILSEDLTTATCQCDHLTNFAMLVSSSPVSAQHHYILSMISLVGCIISMVSLLLTMLFYGSMWSAVKSHHAAVLINLCVALLFGNLVFIAGVERTEIKLVCTIIAALLHYFWLAAFFIMLVEGIQLLLYIIYVFHVRRKRDTVALLIGGWVFPGIIVGISLAVTSMEGYGTEEACWLSPVSGLLWAFVGPVLCVILVNMIIIVIVLRRALSAKIPTAKKKNKLRSAVWNIMVITPLLGITWILGVFSVNEDTLAFQYIFAICNSLQGLFIFIFHALCNKKKGRYALKETTTPSNPKKTHSGSGLKTTSGTQSTRTNRTNSGGGRMNGTTSPNGNLQRNGNVQRNGDVSGSRSSMTMDLHSAPVQRVDSYSPGTRPPIYQQLSDGSEITIPPQAPSPLAQPPRSPTPDLIIIPCEGSQEKLVLHFDDADKGHDNGSMSKSASSSRIVLVSREATPDGISIGSQHSIPITFKSGRSTPMDDLDDDVESSTDAIDFSDEDSLSDDPDLPKEADLPPWPQENLDTEPRTFPPDDQILPPSPNLASDPPSLSLAYPNLPLEPQIQPLDGRSSATSTLPAPSVAEYQHQDPADMLRTPSPDYSPVPDDSRLVQSTFSINSTVPSEAGDANNTSVFSSSRDVTSNASMMRNDAVSTTSLVPSDTGDTLALKSHEAPTDGADTISSTEGNESRRVSVMSSIPPSPNTTTTELSWSSDKELIR